MEDILVCTREDIPVGMASRLVGKLVGKRVLVCILVGIQALACMLVVRMVVGKLALVCIQEDMLAYIPVGIQVCMLEGRADMALDKL